jgi:hypothetical protein
MVEVASPQAHSLYVLNGGSKFDETNGNHLEFKVHIHGIPYIATFIVMQNNVFDGSYSMLLGRPWLRNAKVIHNRGKNLITIESNGVI